MIRYSFEVDEEEIYDDKRIFLGFGEDDPRGVMDYEDYYVIVSEHIVGAYERQRVYASSILYYTETVYAGYNQNGIVLWRTTADSTPDVDKIYGWE